MVTLLLPRCEPGLFWHVRHALGVQILDKVFHGATESVMRMFDAVLCKRQQHAIDVGVPRISTVSLVSVFTAVR